MDGRPHEQAHAAHGTHDVADTTSDWLAFTVWDAVLLAALLAVLAGYVLLTRRTRGGARDFERRAAFAFVLGLGAAFAAASSPFIFLKEGSHLGYMMQLELMMGLSPPLLLLGLRPLLAPVFERSDSANLLSRLGSVPALTLGVWLLTVYAWHAPALHMLGMHSWLVNPIQLTSYAVAGLLFWWPVIRTVDRPGGMSLLAKLGYLALAQAGAALLAALLIFYPEVIYAHGAITQPFGLSALVDQKVSGAVMMVVDMAVASTVGGWILLRALADTGWRESLLLPVSSLRETASGGWRIGVSLGVILIGYALILGTAPTPQPSGAAPAHNGSASETRAVEAPATVRLAPANGSSVSGTADFYDAAGGVKVELDVRGLPEPGATYLAHIHPGRCAGEPEGGTDDHAHHHGSTEDHTPGHRSSADQPYGEIAHPLNPVSSNREGEGSSTTLIEGATIARLFSDSPELHVNIHAEATGSGELPDTLACGDLSGASNRRQVDERADLRNGRNPGSGREPAGQDHRL